MSKDTTNTTENKRLGLGKVWQHDIDDSTKKCTKCRKSIEELNGKIKLCPVVGKEEFAGYRDYDER